MIRRTETIVRQYLAVAFLIVLGLIASGCGDTATVNPVVELNSLTVTPGTLTPAFSSGTTQYNVDLTSDVTSVRITAQPAVAGDTVSINGQATTNRVITLGAAGTTTPVSIVVSESGTNSRTYTVLLNRAGPGGNNSLRSLTVSAGTLAPAFDANLLSYRVDVANDVGTVAVTPILSDSAAKMTVNDALAISEQSSTVSLNDPGQSTSISIVVTAPNGNQKTYLVIVNRGGLSSNNFLQSLTVSSGASNLSLDPRFSEGNTLYAVNVATVVSSVTVKPTLKDVAASMSISVNSEQPTNIRNGDSKDITLGQPDSNTLINIIVTAANGDSNSYVIVVDRAPSSNNNLSALKATAGASGANLINNFNANTTSYTVDVPEDITSMTVSATKADPIAAMLIGSVTVSAGTASGQDTINLGGPGSETPVAITVTPQIGNPKTYLITVRKAASSNNNLSALTVTAGASGVNIIHNFNANTTSYTVDVAEDVTSVTVTATKSDSNAVISGDVPNQGQAPIPLDGPGTSKVVSVIVTAPNDDSKTYRITVRKAASSNNNLSALTVTPPGTPLPGFSPSTLTYTVNVATDVTSVTVTATLEDTNASMTINGQGTSSGVASSPITLGAAGSDTTITIIVIAPNGISNTYTVTVRRAPSSNSNLSALSVSPGALEPNNNPFDPSQLSYTVNVDGSVNSVVISATKADPQATMSVGSVIAAPGVPDVQMPVSLGAGPSTEVVTITVIAQDMASQSSYTITVNRTP